MTIPSQIIDDVKLGTKCGIDIETFEASGGVIISPEEILNKVIQVEEGLK